jgi:hypothetical protein
MPTPRYNLPYGELNDALLRLDTLIYGAWAPRLDGMVEATRTFAYHGGVNNAGTIIPDGTIVVPDGGTYFIHRTAAGVVSADLALDFPTKIPIARATTAGGVLTNFEDMRDLQVSQLVAGVVAYVNAAIDGMVAGTFVDDTDLFATRTAGGIAEKVTALQVLTYITANIVVTTGMLGGDITAAGKALLDDANAAAQRTTLGLGTAALNATGDFEPAGTVATHAAVTSGVHGITAFAATLLAAANAAAARGTLGLGTAALNNTGDFEAAGAVATHAAATSGVHGISAYIAGLLDDPDAATARATLGVISAGTLTFIEVSVATAAGTAAKVGTTVGGSYVPATGDVLRVVLANANTASPTLNVDGSGAKNVILTGTNTNSTNAGGTVWFLYYDGTAYNLFGSTTNTTYSAMSVAEGQTATVTTSRAMRSDFLKQIIDFHAANVTAAAITALGLGTASQNDTGDFEAAGAVAVHAALTSGVHGITAYIEGLLDDASASDARTTLGLGTLAVVNDAPSDGTTYGRKDAAWEAVVSGLTHPQIMARISFGF